MEPSAATPHQRTPRIIEVRDGIDVLVKRLAVPSEGEVLFFALRDCGKVVAEGEAFFQHDLPHAAIEAAAQGFAAGWEAEEAID